MEVGVEQWAEMGWATSWPTYSGLFWAHNVVLRPFPG